MRNNILFIFTIFFLSCSIPTSMLSKNDAKLCSLNDAIKEDLNIYKKIIIGASIRYGKHNPSVLTFVKNGHK